MPLEVTVVCCGDVVPWRYPPRKEFTYGEWLRAEFTRGLFPKPSYDPDLAILLCQARQNSIPLLRAGAADLLEAVLVWDLHRAMKHCVPGLLEWLTGDERNVLLTLARIWVTLSTGLILPKNEAAN